MELRLNSPVGGLPVKYGWPLNQKKGYHEAKEIFQTIIWGCHDIPDLKVPLKKNILKDVDISSYESMKRVTQKFNKAIQNVLALEKGTQKFCDRLNQVACIELLHHIIQQTYSAAVTDVEALNKYQAFSPNVYGETSFDLVNQILGVINLTKDDLFLDLGSGIGQVILQVAATNACQRCIGIERADVPANYAVEMEKIFKHWMQWYGKKYGEFQLIKGDFFDDCYRDYFNQATVIFVNNFAFGPEVDHKLKQRFAELKHGTKIISSRSFCALNFRISDRNLTDIGTIMNVSEITPNKSSVSWTDKPVSYYLHIIDRTKLEKYFQAKKSGSLHSASTEDTEGSWDSDSLGSSEQSITNEPLSKKRKRLIKSEINDTVVEETKNEPTPDIPHVNDISTYINENNKGPNYQLNKLELNRNKIKKPQVIKSKIINGIESLPTAINNTLQTPVPPDLIRKTVKEIGVDQKSLSLNNSLIQNRLNKLMDNFKMEYIQILKCMADPNYKDIIEKDIAKEKKINKYLRHRINKLTTENNQLLELQEKLRNAIPVT